MKKHSSFLSAPWAVAVACTVILGIGGPSVARADVERIREKALELQQKLNKEAFEVLVRAKKPSMQRVYKDFDFLLKKNKVDEVASKEGQDPHAKELRLFLIRSIVEANVATYVDGLRDFEQSSTVNQDNEELNFLEVMKRLAVTPDRAEALLVRAFGAPEVDLGDWAAWAVARSP